MRRERSNQMGYSNVLYAQYQRSQYKLVKAADVAKISGRKVCRECTRLGTHRSHL